MRERLTVEKAWYLEPVIIFVFAIIVAVVIGFTYLSISINDMQDEAIGEINQMGCGELKEFITLEKWDDYSARWTAIEEHAKHMYTWTCEK